MPENIPRRDADDAHADDGPPTDATSDEVKADSAADAVADGSTDDGSLSKSPGDEGAVASVEEPTG